jgi:hypothetical protein
MTTDDSPALGGRSDDNAPMISSVQTRVIADARGAYLAEDGSALFDHMSPAQMLRFKQEMIRLAYDAVLPIFTIVPESEREYPQLLDAVNMVRDWINQPDDDLIQSLTNLRDESFFLPRGNLAETSAFRLIVAICEPPLDFLSLQGGMTEVVTMAQSCSHVEYRSSHFLEIRRRLRKWSLDLAWAIFQGKHVLPSTQIDEETLNRVIADLPTMYANADLLALMYALNAEQQATFRRAIVAEGFKQVESSINQGRREDRRTLKVIKPWALSVEPPDDDVLSRLDKNLRATDRGDPAYRALKELISGIITLSVLRYFSNDPSHTSICMMGAARYAAESDPQIALRSDRDSLARAASDRMQRWQIEVMWAILHDQPIPPLEPT